MLSPSDSPQRFVHRLLRARDWQDRPQFQQDSKCVFQIWWSLMGGEVVSAEREEEKAAYRGRVSDLQGQVQRGLDLGSPGWHWRQWKNSVFLVSVDFLASDFIWDWALERKNSSWPAADS